MATARRALDFYETAPWQVDALVAHLPELRTGAIWCPTVGDGSIVARLRYGHGIGVELTNDIDLERPAMFHLDATRFDAWETMSSVFGDPDWVLDNFPFNVEFPIVKHAYNYARKGVVALSRISFVEGTRERGPWLAEHPRVKQIVLERYSFTGNGKSDSTTCEWCVWAKPGVQIANPGCFTAYGYKNHSAQRTAA